MKPALLPITFQGASREQLTRVECDASSATGLHTPRVMVKMKY